MSFIRLYHAKILTMEEDAEVFDGEVHIDGNRISYVGAVSYTHLTLPTT